MTHQKAKDAARRALQRGRLARGFGVLVIPIVLGGFALVCDVAPLSVAAFVAAASVLVLGAHLRGNVAGDSSLAGSLAGVVPFGSGIVAPNLGHVCAAEYCYEFCLGFCAIGGFSAGFLLGRYARRAALGLEGVLGALLLAAAGGALGCGCVGLTGVGVMIVGLVPGFLAGGRTPRALPAV